ncbi:MAG TPA: SHOCT domain-containing protein [Stackebrandtia sp.]|jgi:putative membrane protein|uniref:SHOCT domain-containing protein n=1 Tax=Stackebrandtia sp. TaxID=2023065 RepID=UPI002D5A83CF|nr:SHOCT domain-containing protein [Stackebrandtia sp.]HZE37590.1 SHOCT domain-containing protein [Stackebrandtia sp.]
MNTITTAMSTGLAHWGHYGWGGGPWFLLFPLFWIAVIVVIAAVFRRKRGGWHYNHGAEGVLRERFAKGEISEEEYRQRLEVLRAKN